MLFGVPIVALFCVVISPPMEVGSVGGAKIVSASGVTIGMFIQLISLAAKVAWAEMVSLARQDA